MLKVDNKKVVSEIANTTYQANKKRNFLTIFAIILTTFLITVIISVGVSYWKTIAERQIRMEGMDYDIELSEPEERQVEKVRSMEQVEYAGVAVKCAVLEQYNGIALDKIRLYWLDETCWEKQTIPALESYEGSYPEKENEIMLGENVLRAMGIENPETGMRLLVNYVILKEGTEEEQPSGERQQMEKEFILSGWYKDYSGAKKGYVSEDFWKTTGVKQTDLTMGMLKITLKNPFYLKKDITGMQNEIGMEGRQYMAADHDTIANFLLMVGCLTALLTMIFVSGYLFIYNTMYISISKDIRYYGQLKTVGMTSVQLKKMIYHQAVRNALAGIPVGLIGAAVTAKLVIPNLVHIANPTFSAGDVVSINPGAFLIGGCFAFLTNLISCRKPAKMAGDCSPIEAIRYTVGTDRSKSKMFRPKKDVGQRHDRKREHSGVYAMAVQNMFRDKKQALIIFSSFVIAIAIFMVVNIIIRENDAALILDEIYSYDIRLKNETTLDDDRQQLLTEDKIAQVQAVEGVRAVRKVTSEEVIIPYQEEVYEDYLKELYQSRYSPGNYEEDMEVYRREPESRLFTPRFISVDESGFEILNESLGNVLNQENFEQGKIAVAVKYFTEGDHGMTGKNVRFYFQDEAGEGKEHIIQIAAVDDGSANPAHFSGGMVPDLIVSEKYAEEIRKELFTELICVEYEEAYAKETEQKVKEIFEGEKKISYDSKLERYSEMKNTETQVKVLGNSVGFIIALLAVLNYLNTIAADIQNRSREFAALESIGMTTRQIRKMLRAEGVGYATITILLSLGIGIPASYIAFSMTAVYRISFAVPWGRDFVLFGFVTVLCMIVPVYLYQRTQTASVIERLRECEEG